MTGRLLAGFLVASAGCGGPTCTSDDLDCILDHLTVWVGRDAPNVRRIPAGTIRPSQIKSSGRTPVLCDSLAPSCGVSGIKLHFDDATQLVGIPFTFTDHCGARPGGCFSVHRPGQPYPGSDGSFGSAPMISFPSLPDGQSAGNLDLFFTSGIDPDGGEIDFDLDFYPLSAADPTQEAVSQALGGGQLCVGDAIAIEASVGQASSSGGGSTCPDGHPCDPSGGHVCCPNGDGTYSCLLSGLCH